MKFLTGLSVALGVCAAGCSASTRPSQPSGFTFNTADGTFASFGWTGVEHHIVGVPDTPFEVKTTECNGEVCRFEGPIETGIKVNRRRCLFRMSMTCSADSDCPLDGSGKATSCVYIYDTPIATPLVSNDKRHVGACGWSYIPFTTPDGKPTISGTLNLATGALQFESFDVLLPLNSDGMGGFAGACAECVGDTTANDGVKDGRCKLATHLGPAPGAGDPLAVADPSVDLGMPCDLNRTGTIGGYDGGYSMDCSPTVVAGPVPLQFGGTFSSSGVEVAITADSPACEAAGSEGKNCFCGMCTDGKTACMSNTDCGAGGKCWGRSIPNDPSSVDNVPVASNLCKTGKCNWDAQAGTGKCDDEMAAGSGSNAPPQQCYPGPHANFTDDSGHVVTISAPGLAEPDPYISGLYHVNTAGARCIAAGANSKLNRQLGLPGLLFQKRNFEIAAKYGEELQ